MEGYCACGEIPGCGGNCPNFGEFEEGTPLEAIQELRDISEERMDLANALLGWSRSLDTVPMSFQDYCIKHNLPIPSTDSF